MEFVLHQDSANVRTITMEVAVKMKKRYYLFHIEKAFTLINVYEKFNLYHSFALKNLQCQRMQELVVHQRKFKETH